MLFNGGGDLPATKGRLEIRQAEKSHARESPPGCNASASQPLSEKDRREARDLGTAQRIDGEMPIDLQTFAGMRATGRPDKHATVIPAESV